jgi:hypothetical protein
LWHFFIGHIAESKLAAVIATAGENRTIGAQHNTVVIATGSKQHLA